MEWQKDGNRISSGGKHKILQHDNAVSLELELLERADAGTYSCKLTNTAGSCECSGALRVKGQDNSVIDVFISLVVTVTAH